MQHGTAFKHIFKSYSVTKTGLKNKRRALVSYKEIRPFSLQDLGAWSSAWAVSVGGAAKEVPVLEERRCTKHRVLFNGPMICLQVLPVRLMRAACCLSLISPEHNIGRKSSGQSVPHSQRSKREREASSEEGVRGETHLLS